MKIISCADCGNSFEGHRLAKTPRCPSCRIEYWNYKMRQGFKHRTDRRNAEGLCIVCGKEPQFHSSKLCSFHWVKNIVTTSLKLPKDKIDSACMILLEKLKGQDFKCFYTNLPLIPGLDASIEHILPRSTHPTEAHKLDNLVWIHREVNRMRGNLPFEEFIRFATLCANSSTLQTLSEIGAHPGLQCAQNNTLCAHSSPLAHTMIEFAQIQSENRNL